MKVRHLFENQVYHLSNYSVPNTDLFFEPADKDRFIEKMHHYLDPIAEILEYGIYNAQFRILVRIKDKRTVNQFFRKKIGDQKTPSFYIPNVSYIVSQQMANLQISYAKYFNFKYRRKGCVFRQRFDRVLLQNEYELKEFKKGIELLEKYNAQRPVWQVKSDLPEEGLFEHVVIGTHDNGLNYSFYEGVLFDFRSQILENLKIDLLPLFHKKLIAKYHQKFRIGPNLN